MMNMVKGLGNSFDVLIDILDFENEKIEKALSVHLPKISIIDKIELKKGYSGSRVYRIKSRVVLPELDKEFQLNSMVLKTNLRNSFYAEARNYEYIPDNVKPHFNKINLENVYQFSEKDVVFYMVMQDLLEYTNLHNLINVNPIPVSDAINIINNLFEILERLYVLEDPEALIPNTSGIIKSLYISKMEGSLKSLSIGNHIDKTRIVEARQYLNELLKIDCIEPKYYTNMHGDLHGNNIMINESDHEIKIIDIDNFTKFGDYIYDVGELKAHIALIGKIYEIDDAFLTESNYKEYFNNGNERNIKKILNIVDKKTSDLAKKFDEEIKERYLLSQARFILTCAKHETDYVKSNIYFKEAMILLKMMLGGT